MRPHKPGKFDKKHPATARDTMDDIKDMSGDPHPVRNEIHYSGANRDRALGENDRTGRHFDGQPEPDEGPAASGDHEAD